MEAHQGVVKLWILSCCNISMIRRLCGICRSAFTAVLNDALVGRLLVYWVDFNSVKSSVCVVSAVGPPATKDGSCRFAIHEEGVLMFIFVHVNIMSAR